MYDFQNTLVTHPWGEFDTGTDGNLYGLTYDGGANNGGVIFKFNPVGNICYRLFDFSANSEKILHED